MRVTSTSVALAFWATIAVQASESFHSFNEVSVRNVDAIPDVALTIKEREAEEGVLEDREAKVIEVKEKVAVKVEVVDKKVTDKKDKKKDDKKKDDKKKDDKKKEDKKKEDKKKDDKKKDNKKDDKDKKQDKKMDKAKDDKKKAKAVMNVTGARAVRALLARFADPDIYGRVETLEQ